MSITPDNAAFIAEGRQILAQKVYGSYELEQLQMFTGLILDKYEELVSGPAEEQVEAGHETSLIVELIADPEIGDRVQTLLRDLGARRSAPTAADIAATPTEPGIYLDRLGNVWHRYRDGVFMMLSHTRASAAYYAPFRRLGVAAAPVEVDETTIAAIVRSTIDRRPYTDETRRAIHGLEHAVGREVAYRRAEWLRGGGQ